VLPAVEGRLEVVVSMDRSGLVVLQVSLFPGTLDEEAHGAEYAGIAGSPSSWL